MFPPVEYHHRASQQGFGRGVSGPVAGRDARWAAFNISLVRLRHKDYGSNSQSQTSVLPNAHGCSAFLVLKVRPIRTPPRTPRETTSAAVRPLRAPRRTCVGFRPKPPGRAPFTLRGCGGSRSQPRVCNPRCVEFASTTARAKPDAARKRTPCGSISRVTYLWILCIHDGLPPRPYYGSPTVSCGTTGTTLPRRDIQEAQGTPSYVTLALPSYSAPFCHNRGGRPKLRAPSFPLTSLPGAKGYICGAIHSISGGEQWRAENTLRGPYVCGQFPHIISRALLTWDLCHIAFPFPVIDLSLGLGNVIRPNIFQGGSASGPPGGNLCALRHRFPLDSLEGLEWILVAAGAILMSPERVPVYLKGKDERCAWETDLATVSDEQRLSLNVTYRTDVSRVAVAALWGRVFLDSIAALQF